MRQERAAAVPPEPGKGIQLKFRLLHGMVTRCFDRDGDFQVIFGAFFVICFRSLQDTSLNMTSVK